MENVPSPYWHARKNRTALQRYLKTLMDRAFSPSTALPIFPWGRPGLKKAKKLGLKARLIRIPPGCAL